MNTKKRIKTVLFLASLAVILTALMTVPASAQLLIEEQFEYEPYDEPTTLNGRDGGLGFSGPWVHTVSHGRIMETGRTTYAGGAITTVDELGGLYPMDPNLTAFPYAGSAVTRYGNAGRAQAHRPVAIAPKALLTQDNTTVWFSMLFSSLISHDGACFAFASEPMQHSPTPGDLAVPGQGFGFTTRGPDGEETGQIHALVFNNSTEPNVIGSEFTPPAQPSASHYDTVLIVGKINWKPDGTPDELYLFDIRDPLTVPDEADAFVSVTDFDFDQSTFDYISIADGTTSIYDEIRFGTTFESVLSDYIDDPNAPAIDAGPSWITWSGEPVYIDATVTEAVDSDWENLTYSWTALPSDGVTIVGADTKNPIVTVTKPADTDDATVVTLVLEVSSDKGTSVIDGTTLDVYDDACKATRDAGSLTTDRTDFNDDCITDITDLAEMSASWLENYELETYVVIE